jgi:hypothetical protein
MCWSIVPFGRYRGKTLPEIIVVDVDWFLWMVPKLYGRLGTEARDLARKARAIKIPKRPRRKFEVEYRFDVDNRFCGFSIVKAESWHSRWTVRQRYLDLARPLRGKKYNKRAGRILIRDFRITYFGKHKRLTKQRCEEFFSNDKNFLSR